LVPLAANLDLVLTDELGLAIQHLDLVALEQHADATGHLLDDVSLEAVYGLQVEFGLSEPDADLGGVLAVPYLGCHVEQRLGRDATYVEAHAADVGLLCASHLQTQLRGADGGVVAPGSRADDDEIELHACLPALSHTSVPAGTLVGGPHLRPPGHRASRVRRVLICC